jgi:hypothetical protein
MYNFQRVEMCTDDSTEGRHSHFSNSTSGVDIIQSMVGSFRFVKCARHSYLHTARHGARWLRYPSRPRYLINDKIEKRSRQLSYYC